MRSHHTKTKGDLGLVEAMADLSRKGWGLLMPLTEHESFDLVAYQMARFLRVQVKYRAIVDGVIRFKLSSSWADRRGVHTRPVDLASIDLVCVYCPETGRCYYVDPQELDGRTVSLRFEAARNYQVLRVVWAKDCTEIPSTVLGVAAGRPRGLEDLASVRQSREPRAEWLVSARSSIG